MNVEYHSSCVIDDNFQLHVTKYVAVNVFDLTINDDWIKIEGLPDLIQVFMISWWGTYLFALTAEGRLLVIGKNHPKGIIVTIDSINHIKCIHIWRFKCEDTLILIGHDNNIYRHQAVLIIEKLIEPGYVVVPQLLSCEIESMILCHYPSDLIWLNRNGTIAIYDGANVVNVNLPYQPLIITGMLLVDEDHTIHRVTYESDRIQLTKIIQVDYEIVDIAVCPDPQYILYNHISTIDEDGQHRRYNSDGRLLRNDNRRAIRFVRFMNVYPTVIEVEYEDGYIHLTNHSIQDFKLLNLDEYYKTRIKSAMS